MLEAEATVGGSGNAADPVYILKKSNSEKRKSRKAGVLIEGEFNQQK